MTGQFRENLAPLQGSCNGLRAWIVGSGSSLDNVPIKRLGGEYIFALNGSIELFTNVRQYPDAWWVWWDIRSYRHVWPRLEKQWDRVQTIIHKRGMEVMRQHRGAGRYICYGSDEAFKPARTVLETAMVLVDFLGFDEAVMVGVDGFRARKDGRPYCSSLADKECHFMDVEQPKSFRRSAAQFDQAVDKVRTKLNHTRFIQTSPLYPDNGIFHRETLEEVFNRSLPAHASKVADAAREKL